MRVCDIQYLRILLTKKCNMSCAFCHQEGCSFSETDIDYDLLMETINKLYNIGFRKFKLMGGEPMLYPNINAVIEEIKSIGPDVDLSMISNGSSTVSRYLTLFDCGLDRLNISIHGWGMEYFCRNTGNSPMQYKKIKASIIELASMGKINKLNYVLQKGKNETDFFNLVEDVKELDVVVDALNLLILPGQVDAIELRYSFSEIENLIRNRWDIDEVIYYDNMYSLPSKRLLLRNGCVINLKVNQLNEQSIFYSCQSCRYKSNCVEGIKAIRLTNDAIIKPCLLRTDNTFKLIDNDDKDKMIEFLRAL